MNPDDTAVADRPVRTPTPDTGNRWPRVLIVDDQEKNRVAFRAVLESLPIRIDEARGADEALELLLTHDYILILMDVQMPGMNGFEAAALIRQRERSQHVPLMFITAIHRTQDKRFEGYRLGAVDYLFKPVDPVVLQSKVQVFVRLHARELQLERQQRRIQQLERAEDDLLRRARFQREILALELLVNRMPEELQPEAPVEPGVDPVETAHLLDVYEKLMERVTDRVSQGEALDLGQEVRGLVDSLKVLRFGARQLLDLHSECMRRSLSRSPDGGWDERGQAGHLVVLEILGQLCDHYRDRPESLPPR